MRTSLKVLKQRFSFVDAVTQAVDFKPPMVRGDARLYSAYAEAAGRFNRISDGLRRLAIKYLDFHPEPVTVGGCDAATAALPYDKTVAVMHGRLDRATRLLNAEFSVPAFGLIDWLDSQSCRFTYFEACRDRGLLTNTVRRIAHTHDLVRARAHRLPAHDVAKPILVQRIIADIPVELLPGTRVITGLQVRENVGEQSRRQQPTWLGEALTAVGQQAERTATAVASAAQQAATRTHEVVTSDAFRSGAKTVALGAGVLAGGVLMAMKAAATATALALADPAVVIGELCLTGWSDAQ